MAIKSVMSHLAKNAIETLAVALLFTVAAWLVVDTVVRALAKTLLVIMTAGLGY
jgi:hypothetical protein